MTAVHDTLRPALLEAIDRDLATGRRPGRRAIGVAAVSATLATGAGVAAATGLLFADPKVPDVPAAPEWVFHEHHPGDPTGAAGPVIMRPRPEALARTNRALEAELARRGTVARCGSDPAHPLACFTRSGDLVAGPAHAEAYQALDGADVLESSPDHYEIRRLTAEEARHWRGKAD